MSYVKKNKKNKQTKRNKKTMENRAWKFVDPFVLVRSLKDLSRNVIWFSYRLKMSGDEMFWEKRKKNKEKPFVHSERGNWKNRKKVIGFRSLGHGIAWLHGLGVFKHFRSIKYRLSTLFVFQISMVSTVSEHLITPSSTFSFLSFTKSCRQ